MLHKTEALHLQTHGRLLSISLPTCATALARRISPKFQNAAMVVTLAAHSVRSRCMYDCPTGSRVGCGGSRSWRGPHTRCCATQTPARCCYCAAAAPGSRAAAPARPQPAPQTDQPRLQRWARWRPALGPGGQNGPIAAPLGAQAACYVQKGEQHSIVLRPASGSQAAYCCHPYRSHMQAPSASAEQMPTLALHLTLVGSSRPGCLCGGWTVASAAAHA